MLLDIGIVGFIFYEICIFFSTIRIIYLFSNQQKVNFSRAELIILWTITGLFISSSLGLIFSFLHFNGPLQYLVSSMVLLLFVHLTRKSNLRPYVNYLSETLENFTSKVPTWKMILFFAIILPLALWEMHPIDETDSMDALSYIINWVLNNTNPYSFQASYVAFWELSYVPSLAITKGIGFLWLTSFKSIIIVGLGTYLVGRKIGLPGRISWMVSISGILFLTLWTYNSGIGTLKNDAIFASGLILICLGIVSSTQTSINRKTAIFLIAGLVFSLVKYQGTLIVLSSIILFVLFNKDKFFVVRNNKKWLILAILLILVTSGHYYVYHLIEFGNPFYPQSVGTNHETSIMSSMRDSELYSILFSPSTAKTTGILFPVDLIVGTLGALITICYFTFKILKKKETNSHLLFLSIILLIAWGIFTETPYSAHAAPGDFFYLKSLSPLRYVEGTVILTEVFLAFVLWKLKVPQQVILGIFGVNLASRLTFEYFGLPALSVNYLYYSIPVAISIILFILRNHLQNRESKIVIISALAISVLILAPQLVDQHMDYSIWWWNSTVSKIYYSQPVTVFQIPAPNLWPNIITTYPLYGNKLQNLVTMMSEDNVTRFLQENSMTNNVVSNPNYIVQLCTPNADCKDVFAKTSNMITKYGYQTEIMDGHQLLMRNSQQ